MKNNAVVKSAKMSRLGVLSLVTWMVVSLSAGTALAATEFTLRHVDKDGVVGEEVKALELKQAEQAIEWTRTNRFDDIVETHVNEPTQILEVVHQAIIAQEKELAKFEKEELAKGTKQEDITRMSATDRDNLKSTIETGFKSVAISRFGSLKAKDAINKLIDVLLKNRKDLAKATRLDLLKALFEGADKKDLLAALSLTTDEKIVAKKKEEPKKEEVAEVKPVVGEISDEDLRKDALQECRNILDQKAQERAAIDEQIAGLQDIVMELMNRAKTAYQAVAQKQAKPVTPNNKVNDMLEELAKRQKAEQDDKDKMVAQAPVAPVAEKEETPAKPTESVMDKLAQPQQQQQNFGGYVPPTNAVAQASNVPQFSPDLPTNTGAVTTITRGQDAAALAEETLSKGIPPMFNMFTGFRLDPVTMAGTLGAALADTTNAWNTVSNALKSTKKKLSQLVQVRDRIKNDANNAIPESLKNLKAEKQLALTKAQQKLEAREKDFAPALMSAGQDQAALSQVMQAKTQQTAAERNAVAQAQADVDAIAAQESLVVSKAKPEIASYDSQINALEDNISELEGQKGKLDTQKTQITGQLAANAQSAQQPTMANRFAGSSSPTTSARGRGLGGAIGGTQRGALGGSMSVPTAISGLGQGNI